MLIIGGRRGRIETDNVQHVTTAEMFDPATGNFATAGDTGLPSIESAFLLPGGKVFLLSGGDVAIYDTATGAAIRTGHSIGQNRLAYAISPLKDGRIMFSGGLKDLVSTAEVIIYYPVARRRNTRLLRRFSSRSGGWAFAAVSFAISIFRT